jgi:hypothetical protein
VTVSAPFAAIGQEILAYGRAHHVPIVAILRVTVHEPNSHRVGRETEVVTLGARR